MNRQNALQTYIVLMTATAAAAIVYSFLRIYQQPPAGFWRIGEMAALVVLGIICSHQRLYFKASSVVNMGSVGQIATVLVLSLPLAIVTVGAAKLLDEIFLFSRGRRRLRNMLVNVAISVLSIVSGALVFRGLHGTEYLWKLNSVEPILAIPALAGLGAAYYVTNSIIVTGAITLSTSERPRSVFNQITRDIWMPELSLILVGIVLGVLWHFSPALSLLIVVPVYLSAQSFAAVARLQEETEVAVKHMAQSIDFRDTGTGDHSKRLEEDAVQLAEALGLTPEHVHDIALAARAHDIGKIGIGNEILLKPGKLTEGEFEVMKQHTNIGADMLASFSTFQKCVEMVRHHHERWDGKGYPDGLKGEEIPLGSRIISVVDAYDAMTSDRPYRAGMAVEEAVTRLTAGIGTQFDPHVCGIWLRVLIDSGQYVPTADEAHHASSDTALRLHIVKAEAG